jgi:hypothetical protein
MSGSSGLRRFVTSERESGAAPAPAQAAPAGSPLAPNDAVEKCEMCATEIPAEHGHLADLQASSLICACRACHLLFTDSGAGRGRYRAIPDRYLTDPAHPMSASEWEALEIPVGLAFFLRDSREGGITGFYPSPAGATECRLDLQAWSRLAADHPLLSAAAPDVEAVLISRSDAGLEYFVVPIDACYELAGRMRLQWRGFDGGAEAKASIAAFLDGVRSRARYLGPSAAGRTAATVQRGSPNDCNGPSLHLGRGGEQQQRSKAVVNGPGQGA